MVSGLCSCHSEKHKHPLFFFPANWKYQPHLSWGLIRAPQCLEVCRKEQSPLSWLIPSPQAAEDGGAGACPQAKGDGVVEAAPTALPQSLGCTH